MVFDQVGAFESGTRLLSGAHGAERRVMNERIV